MQSAESRSDRAAASESALPNYELNADQLALLDHADRYARNELYPLSERMDNEEWWPDDAFPKLGEVGYLGITVAEEFGQAQRFF